MNLNLNFVTLIILFGAVQGLILAVYLFISKTHPGTKFLGAFIFVLAYNGFETFNWSSGLDYFFFTCFPYVIIFGAGPALYLYAKTLLTPDDKISSRTILLHFSPVIFLAVFRTVMFIFYWLLLFKKITPTFVGFQIEMWYLSVTEALSLLSFTFYLSMAWRNFIMNKKSSDGEENNIITNWLWQLLISMTVVSGAWAITIVAPHFLDLEYGEDVHYYPIEIMLVILIYWITFGGHHRTKIIYVHQTKSVSVNVLEAATVENTIRLLHQAMISEKIYLDPELTVAKVSTHIGVASKIISAVLNQHLHKSFNDYVNDHRITEVKSKLLDPANQYLTISGIALDCGFNSQATFQRAFKNFTGKSPREFISVFRNQALNTEKSS